MAHHTRNFEAPRSLTLAAPNRVLTSRAATVRERGREGFTFVELMVVITIIVVLVSMAIPIYQRAITRANETVLASNLFTLRNVIDNYTNDKEKAPQNLQDLVTEGYLRVVPTDPITRRNDTWITVPEDPGQALDPANPGIFEVHSGSDNIGLDGIPYSQK